jgi:hypothetical protein
MAKNGEDKTSDGTYEWDRYCLYMLHVAIYIGVHLIPAICLDVILSRRRHLIAWV